ncbi:NUDIX domain-containing protein [Bacillus salitolerans]|uniref:NUDIX domain-containing protein n=1 Tax=Bacillus salitolerans TaxID=1437434 RepID=A0ABW4LR18_9BACI
MEMIKIFDAQRNQIGVKNRMEVHEKGYWHETFHCWFVSNEQDTNYIYFQLRSNNKKDFPNLLDITAAGHLLADESVDDGIREVQEELGIELSLSDLIPLGVVKDCIKTGQFIDNEHAHVFLYESKYELNDFSLQEDEVSGIVRTEFNAFYELCNGIRNEILIEGMKVIENGQKVILKETVSKQGFVPHPDTYLQEVSELIHNVLKGI